MPIIGGLLAVIAPVFACAAIGIAWSRWGPNYETKFVTTLVVNVGTPCLVFSTLTSTVTDTKMFGTMAFAAIVSIICFAAISALILSWSQLPQRVYLPSLTFGNTGNMGLPLSLFAFGDLGLGLAIVYFTVAAIGTFTFGSTLSSGHMRPRELALSPLNHAVILSILCMVIDVQLPNWVTNPIELIGQLTVPLMLITLGVSLNNLRINAIRRAFWLSILRIGMGFIIGYLLSGILGLEGAMKGVFIIQCAMPVAVFNYLFAQRDGCRPEEVAGLVLISTIISFTTLPLLLLLVL